MRVQNFHHIRHNKTSGSPETKQQYSHALRVVSKSKSIFFDLKSIMTFFELPVQNELSWGPLVAADAIAPEDNCNRYPPARVRKKWGLT